MFSQCMRPRHATRASRSNRCLQVCGANGKPMPHGCGAFAACRTRFLRASMCPCMAEAGACVVAQQPPRRHSSQNNDKETGQEPCTQPRRALAIVLYESWKRTKSWACSQGSRHALLGPQCASAHAVAQPRDAGHAAQPPASRRPRSPASCGHRWHARGSGRAALRGPSRPCAASDLLHGPRSGKRRSRRAQAVAAEVRLSAALTSLHRDPHGALLPIGLVEAQELGEEAPVVVQHAQSCCAAASQDARRGVGAGARREPPVLSVLLCLWRRPGSGLDALVLACGGPEGRSVQFDALRTGAGCMGVHWRHGGATCAAPRATRATMRDPSRRDGDQIKEGGGAAGDAGERGQSVWMVCGKRRRPPPTACGGSDAARQRDDGWGLPNRVRLHACCHRGHATLALKTPQTPPPPRPPPRACPWAVPAACARSPARGKPAKRRVTCQRPGTRINNTAQTWPANAPPAPGCAWRRRRAACAAPPPSAPPAPPNQSRQTSGAA